jgi:hypothetical protein
MRNLTTEKVLRVCINNRPCLSMQDAFEGEGGLHLLSAIIGPDLFGGYARYEVPVAAMQYRTSLKADEQRDYRFIFRPAFGEAEICSRRKKYPSQGGFAKAGLRTIHRTRTGMTGNRNP